MPALPDDVIFPNFSDNLRQEFVKETELFFQSIVQEDRSVLDLLTADFTFVNERLAKHYGIPYIYGSHFRRVTLTDDARRGLLGKGALLMVTSPLKSLIPRLSRVIAPEPRLVKPPGPPILLPPLIV